MTLKLLTTDDKIIEINKNELEDFITFDLIKLKNGDYKDKIYSDESHLRRACKVKENSNSLVVTIKIEFYSNMYDGNLSYLLSECIRSNLIDKYSIKHIMITIHIKGLK